MLALNRNNSITKILIIFFIVINIFEISSLAVVRPTTDFYINDYAQLLDKETKDYIINTNKILYSQTGAQIVVVTIPSLGDNSLEDYATELFRSFGIGDKIKKNGLLLLLALEERQFRVEVGYGLEGILTDSKTGRIQDEYIIPYLKQNNWNDGIKNGFSAFLEIIVNEYNVEVGAKKPIAIENIQENNNDLILKSFKIGYVSVVLGIILAVLKKQKIIDKKLLKKIAVIYFIVLMIVYFNILKVTKLEGGETVIIPILLVVVFLELFNLICFATGLSIVSVKIRYDSGDGFYSGGSSGSSFSVGSSSRRRCFWSVVVLLAGGGSSGRRRKFKKVLIFEK